MTATDHCLQDILEVLEVLVLLVEDDHGTNCGDETILLWMLHEGCPRK